ncbi:MAG: hypothetical protein NC218_11940 [Acetobacter sp.]|nr:hypothetical protein [Acetobacter sp.]
MLPLLNKTQTKTENRTLKTYTFLGVPLFKKEKNPLKRKYTICGLKITQTRKHPLLPQPANEQTSLQNLIRIKDNLIDLNTIKAIIASPNIKVVSFDIFDTLLHRPVINPTDIFYLVDAKLKHKEHINFIKYRKTAEQELNNPHASLKEIYTHIQKRHKLSSKTIAKMYKAELEAEQRLLFKREDIFMLYQYAIAQSKRIIATSDMYLSSRFLKHILKAKGYTQIAAVYVSNEHHKRKDTGDLYTAVIAAEQTLPSQILHIGDNITSDYKMAINQNLTAIHYPSVKQILFSENKIFSRIWQPHISKDPIARLLIGWSLHHFYTAMHHIKNQPAVFEDLTALAKLWLAPLLFHISQSISYHPKIQSTYQRILFASRDGYLPQIAYELLQQYHPTQRPAQYVYAGRRAYYSAACADFADYADKINVDPQEPYTIEHLLKAYISDKTLIRQILSTLTPAEKALDFTKNKPEIIAILRQYSSLLNQYLNTHRHNAATYYTSLSTAQQPSRTSTSSREIIFDCGYSGSVSTSLSPLLNKPVDKIYLWETKKNQQLDKKHKTSTHLLINEPQHFAGHNIICEELFSPEEGGCIGFDEKGTPLFEECSFPPAMQQAMHTLHHTAIQTLNAMFADFAPWLAYMHLTDTAAINAPLAYAITKSPYNEVKLLDPICFPDPSYITSAESLSYKIQKHFTSGNVFDYTGFNNPANRITPPLMPTPQNLKIGIHCHLYNLALAQEILGYLQDFPAPFDLIFTTCNQERGKILPNLFNNQTIKNLQNLTIKTVTNRGRDVAPWLVDTKDIQQNYDLFCHIHGKESAHITFGEGWRHYLMRNLIAEPAARDILNLFAENSNLGLLFPAPYPPLCAVCITHHIEQKGMFNEEKIINTLLKKMNINHQLSPSDLFFSEGTMMWYRPKALEKLFALDLKREDFPPEPIGVGGTIAHAIERLPAIIATAANYQAKTYTKYP